MAADSNGSGPPQKQQQQQLEQQESDKKDPRALQEQWAKEQQDAQDMIQYREEPRLDPKGERKQRTTMQQKKQDELAKAQRRLRGEQTNESRSASRKARRRRIEQEQKDGKHMFTGSLEALEEADANGEMKAMRPFERIGPDSTSMDGPVTFARAERGEIPMRGSHPGQPYYKPQGERPKTKLEETDGLKLTLEANLDIEIELKASIRGDLTLSLMA